MSVLCWSGPAVFAAPGSWPSHAQRSGEGVPHKRTKATSRSIKVMCFISSAACACVPRSNPESSRSGLILCVSWRVSCPGHYPALKGPVWAGVSICSLSASVFTVVVHALPVTSSHRSKQPVEKSSVHTLSLMCRGCDLISPLAVSWEKLKR